MRKFLLLLYLFPCIPALAQDTARYKGMTVNLDEHVVKAKRIGFDVNGFIKRVEEDTTFYRAFKNLRLINFTSDNDIRVTDKKGGKTIASLKSRTKQIMSGNCRKMEVLEEKTTGNFYNRKGDYNYYTAELYANLFFTKGTVCDDGGGTDKGSLARHKSQLKQLIFNPGKPISGVPVVGNKVAIFDRNLMRFYDFSITSENFTGTDCYVFSAVMRKNLSGIDRAEIVYDELITYFNKETMEIVGRKYSLSYKTLVFDFNVRMNVQMTKLDDLLLPALITYDGTWNVPFKKRETAVFTAKFFDFAK
ncbi:hypothetical protein [Chitinophaga barathri]|uniref:Uncharacterized protein n=1 Tax=Chitinophaga barathri TaxID=1647451 RepID=A0A3N4MAZ1_9BACT|nr:hypothetical protein [Chitinophaga barathri]RPD40984.1 hypothetical protein EG028_13295 [Chitinophaga barathri]